MFKSIFRRSSKQNEVPGYVGLEQIAEGSMSRLFRARERDSEQIAVVKVLKPEAHRTIEKLDEQYKQYTEGEILRAFDHPSVIKTFGAGKLGEIPYVVLEYIDGLTLATLLHNQSKRLDGHRVDYLYQTASGLAHVHSRGFIHHDLCPKNLLVSRTDVVKLSDFGLAIPIGTGPKSRSRVGTTEFLAPELLHSDPCDHRIDIFSFGVTAYEVLTGRWAFESAEHIPPLTKILNITPKTPRSHNPEIPEDLSNLIMRCLAKDPQKRVGNMGVVVLQLERHMNAL